jgi:hypothetical protein
MVGALSIRNMKHEHEDEDERTIHENIPLEAAPMLNEYLIIIMVVVVCAK